MKTASVDRLKKYWGDTPPEWLTVLAQACDDTSQKQVGYKIGYSNATINRALGKNYPDISTIKQAVEGALMNATVSCPVMGDLSGNQCMEYQRRKFIPTSSMRVQLYRACRNNCPHYKGAQ